jgi:hypothetical protein
MVKHSEMFISLLHLSVSKLYFLLPNIPMLLKILLWSPDNHCKHQNYILKKFLYAI